MTREEAIRCLSIHSSTNGSGLCTDKQHYEAKQMAIKVLMQEPCTDAVSRQAVLDETIRKNSIWNSITNSEGKNLEEIIFELPSVNPQPCDDVVSREAVLNAICDYVALGEFSDKSNTFTVKPLEKRINDLSPVTQKSGKWIPVSERLPEKSDYCLCCDKDGYMIIGWISKWSKEWYFDDDEVDMDVVAWMPLPEPYKEEGAE